MACKRGCTASAALPLSGVDMIDIANGRAKRTDKSDFGHNRYVSHHYLFSDLHAGQIIDSRSDRNNESHSEREPPSG